jgi:uncharacterized protein YdhG (YjbR/CyaY superfamily)
MTKPADVDAYIEAAPAEAQPLLRELRNIVRTAVPAVTERIAYGMPTYEAEGHRLLNFAAAKNHVGLYGLVHVDAGIPKALAGYADHRSTLQFGFGKPLPTAALTAAIREKVERLRGR